MSRFRALSTLTLPQTPRGPLHAGLGCLLAAPWTLVVALLIKLDSPDPVFYRQQRIGQQGTLFTVLKFRSMRDDAKAVTGPIFADKHDLRIMRVGRVLHTLRLDELTQLLNGLPRGISPVAQLAALPCHVLRRVSSPSPRTGALRRVRHALREAC